MKNNVFTSIVSVALVSLFCATAQAMPDPRNFTERIETNLERETKYEWTELHWAVRHNDLNEARRLLDRGAQINARDFLGRSPLHIAALSGHIRLVELLLNRDADVNAKDQWGVTPLRRMDLITDTRGWDRGDVSDMLLRFGGER